MRVNEIESEGLYENGYLVLQLRHEEICHKTVVCHIKLMFGFKGKFDINVLECMFLHKCLPP